MGAGRPRPSSAWSRSTLRATTRRCRATPSRARGAAGGRRACRLKLRRSQSADPPRAALRPAPRARAPRRHSYAWPERSGSCTRATPDPPAPFDAQAGSDRRPRHGARALVALRRSDADRDSRVARAGWWALAPAALAAAWISAGQPAVSSDRPWAGSAGQLMDALSNWVQVVLPFARAEYPGCGRTRPRRAVRVARRAGMAMTIARPRRWSEGCSRASAVRRQRDRLRPAAVPGCAHSSPELCCSRSSALGFRARTSGPRSPPGCPGTCAGARCRLGRRAAASRRRCCPGRPGRSADAGRSAGCRPRLGHELSPARLSPRSRSEVLAGARIAPSYWRAVVLLRTSMDALRFTRGFPQAIADTREGSGVVRVRPAPAGRGPVGFESTSRLSSARTWSLPVTRAHELPRSTGPVGLSADGTARLRIPRPPAPPLSTTWQSARTPTRRPGSCDRCPPPIRSHRRRVRSGS